MDKYIRNFFKSILNDGGSPVYSGQTTKNKSEEIKESTAEEKVTKAAPAEETKTTKQD